MPAQWRGRWEAHWSLRLEICAAILRQAVNIAAPDTARLISGVLQQCSDDTLAEELVQELKDSGSLLGPDDLVSLIHTCLLEISDECAAACIQLLCSGSAAQQISGSTAQELQLSAVEMQQPQAMAALLQHLPTATQLSGRHLERLLSATVMAALKSHSSAGGRDAARSAAAPEQANAAGWAAAVQAVVSAPAAGNVTAEAVLKLVFEAVKQGCASTVQQLLQHTSLNKVKNNTQVSLVKLAAQQQHACLQAVSQLPGADSCLSADQLVQLLETKVERDDNRMVVILCGMKSAQRLQQQQVLALLRAAVMQGRPLASVAPLCKLQAAAKLSAAAIVSLIDEVEDGVHGLQAAAKKQRTSDFNSIVRVMKMGSTASSAHKSKTAGVAAASCSASPRAKQVSGLSSNTDLDEQRVSPRKQLGLQAVTALQELQNAILINGRRLP
jgi:hypothetical protein